MYIAQEKLKKICKNKGLSIKDLLDKAKISKTAFYTFIRKENILPKSIQAIARALDVRPSLLLEEESREARKIRRLSIRLEKILRENPNADRDNVWHTLLLLTENPLQRLRRAILRAQKFNFHR